MAIIKRILFAVFVLAVTLASGIPSIAIENPSSFYRKQKIVDTVSVYTGDWRIFNGKPVAARICLPIKQDDHVYDIVESLVFYDENGAPADEERYYWKSFHEKHHRVYYCVGIELLSLDSKGDILYAEQHYYKKDGTEELQKLKRYFRGRKSDRISFMTDKFKAQPGEASKSDLDAKGNWQAAWRPSLGGYALLWRKAYYNKKDLAAFEKNLSELASFRKSMEEEAPLRKVVMVKERPARQSAHQQKEVEFKEMNKTLGWVLTGVSALILLIILISGCKNAYRLLFKFDEVRAALKEDAAAVDFISPRDFIPGVIVLLLAAAAYYLAPSFWPYGQQVSLYAVAAVLLVGMPLSTYIPILAHSIKTVDEDVDDAFVVKMGLRKMCTSALIGGLPLILIYPNYFVIALAVSKPIGGAKAFLDFENITGVNLWRSGFKRYLIFLAIGAALALSSLISEDVMVQASVAVGGAIMLWLVIKLISLPKEERDEFFWSALMSLALALATIWLFGLLLVLTIVSGFFSKEPLPKGACCKNCRYYDRTWGCNLHRVHENGHRADDDDVCDDWHALYPRNSR